MNESEWLTSQDPQAMLRLARGRISSCCGAVWCRNDDDTESLADEQRCCPLCDAATPAAGYWSMSTDRQLRLFACAVWRQRMASTRSEKNQRRLEAVVELAEQMADNHEVSERRLGRGEGAEVEHVLFWQDGHQAARDMAIPALKGEGVRQADALRDTIGNPYRPFCLPLDRKVGCTHPTEVFPEGVPLWECSWLSLAVQVLAQDAYHNRLPGGELDSSLLTLLADALTDSGCPEEVLCHHCRGTGLPPTGLVGHQGMCVCSAYDTVWRVHDGLEYMAGRGRLAHPLLDALRRPGKRYRGFWALDAVLHVNTECQYLGKKVAPN